MVMTDLFTKWAEAIAVPDVTAETTSRVFFDEFVCRFGPPEKILSDRGSNYTSKLVDEVMKLVNTTHVRTTSYHPQCNGQAERLNQVVKTQLATMVNEEGEDWDDFLPPIMFAYRSLSHSTTGVSPYKAVFGVNARLPADVSLTRPKNYKAPAEYANRIQSKLVKLHEVMGQTSKENKTEMKERYDNAKKRRLPKPKDWVLVKRAAVRDGANPKLQAKFDGPYMVQRVFGNGCIEILKGDKKEKVNVSRTKNYDGLAKKGVDKTSSESQQVRPKKDQPTTPTAEYEVEKIVEMRTTRNRNGKYITQYLLTWTDNSLPSKWIDEEKINAPRLMKEFWAQQRQENQTQTFVGYVGSQTTVVRTYRLIKNTNIRVGLYGRRPSTRTLW
jgi:hypothetical protein